MISIVCKTCGSDDIVKDAWAKWDYSLQQWVLLQAFDNVWCEKCEGETNLIEVENETTN